MHMCIYICIYIYIYILFILVNVQVLPDAHEGERGRTAVQRAIRSWGGPKHVLALQIYNIMS